MPDALLKGYCDWVCVHVYNTRASSSTVIWCCFRDQPVFRRSCQTSWVFFSKHLAISTVVAASSGSWTPDLSHQGCESYPWTSEQAIDKWKELGFCFSSELTFSQQLLESLRAAGVTFFFSAQVLFYMWEWDASMWIANVKIHKRTGVAVHWRVWCWA